MDKKNLAIIILVLILIGIGGIYAYNYVSDKSYQQGFKDATLLINQQIVSNLYESGFIVVYVPTENNQTVPVKLIPYMENQDEQ